MEIDMKEKFDVTGMSCSACSSHVEKSVSKLEGIKTVSVNLLTNSMQVEYDETKLDTGKIIEAVEHAGYGASVKEDGKAAVKAGETEDAVSIQQKNIKNMKTRLIISVIFLIPLMYVSMGHMIYNALGVPMPPLTMKFFHGSENAVIYAFTQRLYNISAQESKHGQSDRNGSNCGDGIRYLRDLPDRLGIPYRRHGTGTSVQP